MFSFSIGHETSHLYSIKISKAAEPTAVLLYSIISLENTQISDTNHNIR